ncbi:uncharacterized protein N7483_013005 [Penicillium malachiteum]|uniref:uncharacterized protein n=1 Tax=Penicillium malachiteum TaxID=1324776 RepID=UPI0025496E3B|nr:uncharacterized protein N7483_013005 [Penicillium malachiteum]KAJ5715824.1 hypothetical protein N7483_013005 [Penicillium malachiteum]
MTEKNISRELNGNSRDDATITYSRLGQSTPPNGTFSLRATRSPSGADGVNSLLTPLSEESSVADSSSSSTDSRQVNDFSGRTAPDGKIAIPRDLNSYAVPIAGRVLRACSSCRTRKVKCSGEQPACRQCRELDLLCRYPMGWREEMKKKSDDDSAVLKDYQDFVQDLLRTTDISANQWIHTTLQKYRLAPDDIAEPNQTPAPTPIIKTVSLDLKSDGPLLLGTNQTNTRASCEKAATSLFNGESASENGDGDFAETFRSDSLNPSLGDFTSATPSINKYSLPPRNCADQLFEDYLTSVHPEFPIVHRPLFRSQYLKYWEHAEQPGDKWLAILNMMFAIASLYATRTRGSWQDDENDHRLYFKRAKLLSMTEAEFFSRPDLQQVQVEGLCAFYLLASDQFEKSWRISGMAVRSAVTLCINSQITTTLHFVSREARCRLWWCVYTFEKVLGLLAYRTTSIPYDQHTIPFPLPFQEENYENDILASSLLQSSELRFQWLDQAMSSSKSIPNDSDLSENESWLRHIEPNSGLYFLFYCDLAVIVGEIASKLSKSTAWPDKESRIGDLQNRLESWRTSLPDSLDFGQIESENNISHVGYKFGLAFHYHSARIAFGRPWLYRRDTLEYDHTTYKMAQVALDAARNIIYLIPDELDKTRFHQICPWWCVLHYLTHAAKTILLELSLGSIHMREDESSFIWLVKKSLRCFHTMSYRSLGAKQAWEFCDRLYRNLSARMGYSTDGIPSVDLSDLNVHNGNLAFSETSDLERFDIFENIGTSV